VRAEIKRRMAQLLKFLENAALQGKTGVIGGHGDAHRVSS